MAEPKRNMPFEFEGRRYEFNWKLSIRDAMFLKKEAHISPTDLFGALDRRDPEAVRAFVFLTKRNGGEAIRWEDTLDWSVFDFDWKLDEPDVEEATASEDEEAEGSDVGPTSTAGKTQKSGTSKTAKS